MSGTVWTFRYRLAKRALPLWLGAALACGPAGSALAKDDGDIDGPVTISRPVVQAIPGGDGMTLNAALARLAQNPRDVEALIDAGNAALKMGDADAASGFYRRAEQVAPGNARAKAGLAGALVRGGNPFDAIPLFQQAEQGGALDGTFAADRGLAYDLVGDNASAQRFYRLALSRGTDDEVTRRLALSQAIAGDRKGAEATLTPLLRRQDKAAWRARAFSLAIGGDVDQSITIAKTILPPDLATAITPYLRYMPRLTRAQQAAAATFGAFPRASEIGQDDPRIAFYAPTGASRPAIAAADPAVVSKREQPGRRSRARVSQPPARQPSASRETRSFAVKSGEAVRVAPPDVKPAIETPATHQTQTARQTERAPAPPPAAAPVAATPARPAPAAPRPSVELPPVSAVPRVAAQTAPPAPAAAPPAAAPAQSMASPVVASSNPLPAATAPMPGFDTVGPPRPADTPIAAASPTPAPAAASTPAPARRISLAEAFREFGSPARDVAPATGAVDIRHITPSRAKPPAPEVRKPAPPSHPSRIWVQIATGRDKGALAFDWRRMTRQNADAFKGRTAFVSDWGQTNRLLTGPFASASAASTFLAQLRRAGIDGPFVWTSPAGQVVDALP